MARKTKTVTITNGNPKPKKPAGAKNLVPASGDKPTVAPNGKMRVFTVNMPTMTLLAGGLPRNLHQRNEALRNHTHLEAIQPEHLNFACVQGFDGEVALVDGHTRIMLWAMLLHANPSALPPEIRLTVYDILDPDLSFRDEELRLYNSYDSRTAVKTSAQTIQGAMNSIALSLKSTWMAAGQFASALTQAGELIYGTGFKKKSRASQLLAFRDELIALDAISPRKKEKFHAAFTASALILLNKAPQKTAISILKKYNEASVAEHADHVGDLFTPIELLMEYLRTGPNNNGAHRTGGGELELSTKRLVKMMSLAVTDGKARFRKDDPEVESFSSDEISVLKFPAKLSLVSSV